MTTDLPILLGELRQRVESRLDELLRTDLDWPAELQDAVRYSLLAPGKRLRPLLVLLASRACGGMVDQALSAACAVEMVHTYSLIHDDLPAMDDDDLRRGLPTCHRKFGEALAILAGDALLTQAFQVLAEGVPTAIAGICCSELARGAGGAGMVGGQVEDLAWENDERHRLTRRQAPGLVALENIHSRKTGALFRASLRLGGIIGAAERPESERRKLVNSLDLYGRCFGQAFQITDDLLDVEGDAAQTGKRVGKDADRGKLTYPGLLGVSESRQRAVRLCEEACQHLQYLGSGAAPLAALARTLVERDR